MRASTKVLISVVVAGAIYFGLAPQIQEARTNSLENAKPVNAFSSMSPTPEASPEIPAAIPVEQQETAINEACKSAEDTLSNWSEVYVRPVADSSGSTTVEISIVSDDTVALAKKLCAAGEGETAEWYEPKYELERIGADILGDLEKSGVSSAHVEIRIFSADNYKQFVDTDGAEDSSVLYIRDGEQINDAVFDFVPADISYDEGAVPVTYDVVTSGMLNALKQADSYLSHSAFSRSGLIDQLVYHGYTRDEAIYAVNTCGADWEEQAALKAASYLSHSAFSKKELIEQLEYEGFTHAQAVHGVNSVYD